MSVLTIGEVVVDWFSLGHGENLFEASPFACKVGGNATNVAVGLSRLGLSCRVLGKVGQDRSGLYLKQKIEQEGVDTSFIKVEAGLNTGHCYIYFGQNFDNNSDEPTYSEWPRPHAAQSLTPEDISEDAFSGIKLVHLTGISLKDEPRCFAVQKAAQMAKQKNLIFSFDSSCPVFYQTEKLARYAELMHLADIIKVNNFELGQWTNSTPQTIEEIKAKAQELMEVYKSVCLIVTLGSQGSLLCTKNGALYLPPISMNTPRRNSIGAGDAFMAGFIHGLLTRIPEGH
ncbi:MAG: carbohydrate kinase family protein, partial [Gammaproteobacteria bacterium]|nr:carbohydrate kinase family protein [Gammaproteobacteria bacterium]